MAGESKPVVLFFDLGRTLTFTDPSTSQRTRYADALDVLQILSERGYRLGLLSNQLPSATVNSVYAVLAEVGLDTYIERELVTISSEIANNQGKPHQPIFDLALAKAGHAAASDDAIFVTEAQDHVDAARGFGWRAVRKRNGGSCQPADGECAVGLAPLLDLLPPLTDLSQTNLHLAPPVRSVDGLRAVPIDIERIDASLIFDTATSATTGDATLEFTMGPQTGHPIFDLRQTITEAWLDGVSIPVAKLAYHDFGGGSHAKLRVVESMLAAGSHHTLRVTYDVSDPDASPAGSYQPTLSFEDGSRLIFNFGFTDLGAGRYLEAFVPANLVFDQYEVALELEVQGTGVAHTVITNGVATSLAANRWRVEFPSRSSAFSPLLELRAADTVTMEQDPVQLPVSGQTVTVEAWKLTTSSVSLSDRIDDIKTWLAENESDIGPYLHGDRFVAFIHQGGMEYDGGTTSSTGPLRHETHHSWWGRGLKPASQPDGWWDEGWSTYHDIGGASALPFDFSDSPVTLRPANPWVRVTSGNAYGDGSRLFEGLAAMLGVSTLTTLMRDFYRLNRHRPATTVQLEEFLLCRAGIPQVVDAFHRFVYGHGNPSPVPNLWLRDHVLHGGTEHWSGAFWNSPDLWVRNKDDGGLSHQSPEYGQDNWFYARVRNLSAVATAQHFAVTFNVKPWAGFQFEYPSDFLPCVGAATGFGLGPGQSTVVRARWPRLDVPAAGTHACLLASVITVMDHPATGVHVWEHNNLAQKNLTVVDLAPNTWFLLPVVVINRHSFGHLSWLELVRPKTALRAEAMVLHRTGSIFRSLRDLRRPFDVICKEAEETRRDLLDCGGHADRVTEPQLGIVTSRTPRGPASRHFEGAEHRVFEAGPRPAIAVVLEAGERVLVGLRVRVPRDARKGDVLAFDLIQRDEKRERIQGGVAFEIHVG